MTDADKRENNITIKWVTGEGVDGNGEESGGMRHG
jgi:hypothetical protein